MFENFLSKKFLLVQPWHKEDGMADAFGHWLSQLDVQELIDYAEEWGKTLKNDRR